MSQIGDAAQRFLDLLFPPRCVLCGAAGAVLCANHASRVFAPPCRLSASAAVRSLSARLSAESQGAPMPLLLDRLRAIPHLDGLRAASVYDGAVRQAILALKFRGQRRVASPLADLLVGCCRHETLAADLIVPIPLHANRHRERGYDQARLLGQPLPRLLQRPVRTDLLVRSRATRAQMTLLASRASHQCRGRIRPDLASSSCGAH